MMNRKHFSKLISVSALLCGLLAVQTASASGPAEEKRLSFTIPSAPWSLTLPAADFELAQQKLKPDGSGGYFYLTDQQSHLNVSFFIEPVGKCKDSKSCRDMVLKAGNPTWENLQNVKSSQLGEVYYFEFLMPSLKGVAFRQQNMYAQFVVDGYWHISKVLYEPEEHVLFEDLVKAIKFEPKEKKTSN
jgi:hypothetical protein